MVWIDGRYDIVGVQERAKYKRSSAADIGPVDVVKYAETFGAKGLIHTNPAKSRGAAVAVCTEIGRSRGQSRDRAGACDLEGNSSTTA
jgi:thiamine pyrophosphate-dependent acetolactate synthase large subunit-like protein